MNASNITASRWPIRTVEGSDHVRIANSNVTLYGLGSGVVLADSDVRVEGNDINCSRIPDTGAIGTGFNRDVRIANNTITGCGQGIFIAFVDGFRIENNTVLDTGVAFNTAGCGQGRAESNWHGVISNNVARNVTRGGGFGCLRNFTVEHNEIFSTDRGFGVSANPWAPGEPGLIKDNHVYGAKRDVFGIGGAPRPYKIESVNNTADDERVMVAANLRDAVLDGRGEAIAYLMLVDAENVTVRNWVIDKDTDGASGTQSLQIVRGRNVSVEQNRLLGGGLLADSPGSLVIKNNRIVNGNVFLAGGIIRFEDNTYEAPGEVITIWYAGEESHTYIVGNTLNSTGSCIICAFYSYNLDVQNNTITSSYPFTNAPISLVDDHNTTVKGNNIISAAGRASISRSIRYGNAPPDSVDARGNYWGSSDGPDDRNADSERIVYAPWLTAPSPSAPVP